jgi:hypothetical protein
LAAAGCTAFFLSSYIISIPIFDTLFMLLLPLAGLLLQPEGLCALVLAICTSGL